MAESESDKELIEQLKQLVKALNEPKKDLSKWFGILVSFLSTVVIAGLSLYFANLQSERSFTINAKQLDIQRANQKLEQMKTLSTLIPELAGKDTALRAKMTFKLLEISTKSLNDGSSLTDSSGTTTAPSKRVIKPVDEKVEAENTIVQEFFVQVKLLNSYEQPTSVRKSALEYIGKVGASPKSPETLRETAVQLATNITRSAKEPKVLRETADDILKNIRNVTVSQLKNIIAGEQVDRNITGVIIHHVGEPLSISKYRGLESVKAIANIQMKGFQWNNVSWHYLIVPDGTVWLGTPLGLKAIHAGKLNSTTVSILLYLDGNIELPTEAQKTTLQQLIPMITAKVKIDNSAVHTHNFADPGKSVCPGKNITEAYIHQLL